LWINFDGPFKTFIKEAIIATLASPSKVVRSQVSSLIAAVAQIEIPRQEWGELLPKLCEVVQSAELT
jgi:importin subunit beta-1